MWLKAKHASILPLKVTAVTMAIIGEYGKDLHAVDTLPCQDPDHTSFLPGVRPKLLLVHEPRPHGCNEIGSRCTPAAIVAMARRLYS